MIVVYGKFLLTVPVFCPLVLIDFIKAASMITIVQCLFLEKFISNSYYFFYLVIHLIEFSLTVLGCLVSSAFGCTNQQE